MLARYQMFRGKPPAGMKLPDGVRQDTRKHTRHCLRPPAELVTAYLAAPSTAAWGEFEKGYVQCLESRWREDRTPFDELADLASTHDVYLGCSCPTAKNPEVRHCHTVLALRFMQAKYPELEVAFPRFE